MKEKLEIATKRITKTVEGIMFLVGGLICWGFVFCFLGVILDGVIKGIITVLAVSPTLVAVIIGIGVILLALRVVVPKIETLYQRVSAGEAAGILLLIIGTLVVTGGTIVTGVLLRGTGVFESSINILLHPLPLNVITRGLFVIPIGILLFIVGMVLECLSSEYLTKGSDNLSKNSVACLAGLSIGVLAGVATGAASIAGFEVVSPEAGATALLEGGGVFLWVSLLVGILATVVARVMIVAFKIEVAVEKVLD